ncbi:MAG: extracellular solute-binding protein [Ruminiclostridium sp.]|nr:extracellular solute-binding protein [Ruminiclostridium sp.]
MDGKYSKYYNDYLNQGVKKPDKEITIYASDYTGGSIDGEAFQKGATDEAITNAVETIKDSNGFQNLKNFLAENTELETSKYETIKWKDDKLTLTYKFTVAETGLYNLEAIYYPISGKETSNTVLDIGLKLDGEYPFTAAKDLTLDRYWKDESEIKRDGKDNDLRPGQVTYDCWVKYPIKDKEGLYNDPYFFYLEKGEHTLEIEGIRTYGVFHSFTFKNYDELPSYESIKPSEEDIQNTPALTSKNEELGTNTIFLQAEEPLYKTASTLYATYDRTTYMTNPSHPTKQRYNTVGQATWNKSTQAITYSFKVENDGYYRFNFKARQNQMRGFFSNRRIYIDGVVPCKELDDVQFVYSPDWQAVTPKDEAGNDIYLFLKAGVEHTITMEAIPGSIGAVMQRLDDLVLELNQYYRRILMITGPKPDEFNDYFVEKKIPDLIPAFERIVKSLRAEKEGIEKLTKKGSEAAALETMAIYLEKCIKDKEDIPIMAASIKDSISSVSAWMRDYRDQPLELDYLEIATCHESFSAPQGNFFSEFLFGFNSFIGSFFEDYTVLSDSSATSLDVWVSLARDQATVVKNLVDNKFNSNPKFNGTQASINLVQGSILEATLAGKGPEIALFIGGDFPIQLAARGLLVDVTQFKDYEEVTKRFADDAMTLYEYNDGTKTGVYGLPVSQNFPMLFYRTDVLEELGFEGPPKTWDELIEMLPTLQRKYLDVGLILPQNISSNTFDLGNTFVMLMLQSGQDLYNEDLYTTDYSQIKTSDIKSLNLTNFMTQDSIKVFEKWTKFYTVFSFDQTFDAFSRFRTGEMPLVIQAYTFYNQLSVAAPEIKGLWDFTVVPGTVRADGTISHAANSAGAGAVIFNKVSNQAAAWEFVKWFTETDTQVDYGKQIEALMGPMGRFDTANVDALDQLPWSTEEYEKISTQQAELREVPIIPASYAVTRHVNNAFRMVVNDAGNPRYTLMSYNDQIKSEIVRKYQELSSMK